MAKPLTPTAKRCFDSVVEGLYALAEETKECRPHMSPLYRALAESVDMSVYPKDSTFTLRVPDELAVEQFNQWITIRQK